MRIGPEHNPVLRLEDGSEVALASVVVEREAESSYLRDLRPRAGNLPELAPGSRVALLGGESVIFVGVVQADGSVLDFLSSSALEGEYEDI